MDLIEPPIQKFETRILPTISYSPYPRFESVLYESYYFLGAQTLFEPFFTLETFDFPKIYMYECFS